MMSKKRETRQLVVWLVLLSVQGYGFVDGFALHAPAEALAILAATALCAIAFGFLEPRLFACRGLLPCGCRVNCVADRGHEGRCIVLVPHFIAPRARHDHEETSSGRDSDKEREETWEHDEGSQR